MEQPTAGPIRKLPFEMLSRIFQYHVDSGSSPWILANVSKAWLRTAMMTPQLWSYIWFSDRSLHEVETFVVDGKTFSSLYNYQVCCDIVALQAALQRSGAVQLKLVLRSVWRSRASTMPMLHLTLTGPTAKRVYSLDMRSIDDFDDLTDLTVSQLPVLREIKLPHSAALRHKLLEAVALTSPHLESVGWPGGLPKGVAGYNFWTQIKHISMRNFGVGEDLNEVAGRLVSLEHIQELPNGWPNKDTPKFTWKHVKELDIRYNPGYLGLLDLPNLEILKLAADPNLTYPTSGGHDPVALYPKLNTLELNVWDPKWPEYTAGAFPAVETLRLKCEVGDELIMNILETMPHVRKVTVLSSRNNFGLLLLQGLTVRGKILCPKLERLRLGDKGRCVRTLAEEVAPLVKQLVTFRRQEAKPLLEATVCWKHPDEVIDYAAL